jgi:hypothetical protein
MLFDSVSHNGRLGHSGRELCRRQMARRRMNSLCAVHVVNDVFSSAASFYSSPSSGDRISGANSFFDTEALSRRFDLPLTLPLGFLKLSRLADLGERRFMLPQSKIRRENSDEDEYLCEFRW